MKTPPTPKLDSAPPGSQQPVCSATEDDLLSREELLRRYRNQYDLLQSYSACLDGIPEIRCIPGASIEGCRFPDDIRRIVTMLVAHCQTTWEHGWQGRTKSPNTIASGAYQLGYLAAAVAQAARTPRAWRELRREVLGWHRAFEAAKKGGAQ